MMHNSTYLHPSYYYKHLVVYNVSLRLYDVLFCGELCDTRTCYYILK